MRYQKTTTTTEEKTEESYRLQPVEEFVARAARSPFWQQTSLSSYVAGGMILFLTLYSILVRTDVVTDPLIVENREFGSVERALERIQEEHYITLAELDELSQDPELEEHHRLAHQYTPLIMDETHNRRIEQVDDVPIGVYYTYSVTTYGDTEIVHIEYWMYFSDENIGTPTAERMARWGHSLDRELIYRINILNGQPYGAEYQAPVHQLIPFTYPLEGRPIFRIASGNHNFQLIRSLNRELRPETTRLLAPRPLYERDSSPLADNDIMALAAHEALFQHEVDYSNYVFVGIEDPAYVLREPYPAEVDVGILTQRGWNYLHNHAGRGVVVWGYRLVAIDVGFSPTRGDISQVRLALNSSEQGDRPGLRVARVFIYPELRIPA